MICAQAYKILAFFGASLSLCPLLCFSIPLSCPTSLYL